MALYPYHLGLISKTVRLDRHCHNDHLRACFGGDKDVMLFGGYAALMCGKSLTCRARRSPFGRLRRRSWRHSRKKEQNALPDGRRPSAHQSGKAAKMVVLVFQTP